MAKHVINKGEVWCLTTGQRVIVQKQMISNLWYAVRFAGTTGTEYIAQHWFDYKIGG